MYALERTGSSGCKPRTLAAQDGIGTTQTDGPLKEWDANVPNDEQLDVWFYAVLCLEVQIVEDEWSLQRNQMQASVLCTHFWGDHQFISSEIK